MAPREKALAWIEGDWTDHDLHEHLNMDQTQPGKMSTFQTTLASILKYTRQEAYNEEVRAEIHKMNQEVEEDASVRAEVLELWRVTQVTIHSLELIIDYLAATRQAVHDLQQSPHFAAEVDWLAKNSKQLKKGEFVATGVSEFDDMRLNVQKSLEDLLEELDGMITHKKGKSVT